MAYGVVCLNAVIIMADVICFRISMKMRMSGGGWELDDCRGIDIILWGWITGGRLMRLEAIPFLRSVCEKYYPDVLHSTA